MFLVLEAYPDEPKELYRFKYFRDGLEALRTIETALAATNRTLGDVDGLLEFACG